MEVVSSPQVVARRDEEAMVNYLRTRIGAPPEMGIVLGSGLGELTEHIEGRTVIPYSDIPGFPRSSVEGQAPRLVCGCLAGRSVLLAAGRFHLYEGHDWQTVTLLPRLFAALGVVALVITNAAGSVNPQRRPGTLLAVRGHLDCTFRNGTGLPAVRDEATFHEPTLRRTALKVATALGVEMTEGVYAWTLGPSYETPAEVRMVRNLGGDAVGMSTVPEIEEAGRLGMRVLTISCLTNFAAGITPRPLTHAEVIETAAAASESFCRLMKGIVREAPVGEATWRAV